jgi:ElaB/YqjD/DUF883 family membrane-anchored ribosome-binding protein
MTAKDTFGSVGCEDLDTSRLLRSLMEVLETLVASETAEAIEQVRGEARTLLAEMRPAIDRAARTPDRLQDAIRKNPLLALGLAGLAGFVLASLNRR